MIYANYTVGDDTGHNNVYASLDIKSMDEWDGEDKEPIFYYDRHDEAIRRVTFNEFLTFELWKEFKKNENSKIAINFSDDYLNAVNLQKIIRTIKIKGLDTSRIYFIVMDQQYVKFVTTHLEKHGIKGINITHFNFLLKNVIAPRNLGVTVDKKFSSLSRNYHPWRAQIYGELAKKDLLKDFIFSFHNYFPYGGAPEGLDNSEYPINLVEEDLKEGKIDTNNKLVKEFLNNIPYTVGIKHAKWNIATYNAIYSADFHLLIESHWDCYLGNIWAQAKEDFDEKEFAPTFATEKLWKAINCKKPFIAVSTPFWLEGLRNMGYKTFSPFIDETYDTLTNNEDRRKAIVEEVERICTLPDDEYQKLLVDIQPIIDHNFKLYCKNHMENEAKENYPWMDQFLPFQPKNMTLPTLTPSIYE